MINTHDFAIWYGHWKHWSSSSFFLSLFNFAFSVVRDKVEINKYANIDKHNNQPSWWNKLGQYKEFLHGQENFLTAPKIRRFQVGKIGRAHLSCLNSQWEHNICLNHLASHIHCNSQQNKLCLWWIVTILHTLDLSKSLCFKRFFSYKKRKNKTKSTIN